MLFTVLQITPVCFQNESKMTANVCNPINKPRNFIIWKVTYHICSKVQWLRCTRIKYSTIFYLHNQKTALNGANQAFPWCAPALSANHWVRTEWVRISATRFWFHGSHRVFIRTGVNHGKPVNKETPNLFYFIERTLAPTCILYVRCFGLLGSIAFQLW